MKLVIDIGNSMVKAGVFEGMALQEINYSPDLSLTFIDSIACKYENISHVILSSVKEVNNDVIEFLKKLYSVIEFSEDTAIPITNNYKTTATLGKDRLAGVVAAYSLYPKENILVIDAGTCITYDLITSDHVYSGGSISPGLSMRCKALHAFTGKLPLIQLNDYHELIGTDTETSILSGVINGAVAEMDGIIERYRTFTDPLKVVLCGGDGLFFADRLKSSIFAVPELVLIGLNEILNYNEL